MDKFICEQFRNNPDVDPHITLYMFKYWAPGVEVVAIRQNVDIQLKSKSDVKYL